MGAPSSPKKGRSKNQKANLFTQNGRWGVRIKLPTFYQQHEYKRLVGTRAEAEEDRERVKRLVRLKQPLETAPLAGLLLKEFMEEARLAWHARDPRHHYSDTWIEWGGHKRIVDITRPRIQEALRELREDFSAATVKIMASSLKAAFSLAVDRGVMPVERDPFFRPLKLEPGNERDSPLAAESIIALLSAAGPKNRNLILFAILSGLRYKEQLGLRWECVNFQQRFLSVRRTKQKKPHREPLSDWMVEILEEQKALGSEWVFPNRRGLQHKSANIWTYWYKKAGIYGQHTWHDLRHTCATLAACGGESLLAIGRILGQGNPQTTRRYAHYLEDAARSSLETVSSGLRKQLEGN